MASTRERICLFTDWGQRSEIRLSLLSPLIAIWLASFLWISSSWWQSSFPPLWLASLAENTQACFFPVTSVKVPGRVSLSQPEIHSHPWAYHYQQEVSDGWARIHSTGSSIHSTTRGGQLASVLPRRHGLKQE